MPNIKNNPFDIDTKIREKHNKIILLLHLRRFIIKLHSKKWMNVNAEIVCRPNTGIEWFKFKDLIDAL
jgi:hypothetical protein